MYPQTGGGSGCFSLVSSLYFCGSDASLHSLFLQSPMIKLIALFRNPSDTAEFDKHYFEVHIPLVRKFPGLRRLEVTRVTGAPIGEAKFHLMAEMYFDTKDGMDAALASPEGKAVTRDIMSFAADVITVFHGEAE